MDTAQILPQGSLLGLALAAVSVVSVTSLVELSRSEIVGQPGKPLPPDLIDR